MKKIICYVFGHKYVLKRKISGTIQELYCGRCNREFGINHDVRCVLPLTEELKTLHQEIINP